ncbi:MAG: OmpA family protein, partial [Pseudomonadota bacterium]
RKPAVAARAQVMYDCWVEEEHEDIWLRQPGKEVYQPEDIARCKNAFLAAYNELLQEGRFSIYHRFNKWRRGDLAAAEAGKLSGAIATAKASGSRVNINGHTDTVGSATYNLGLSKRRANMVRDALMQAGIPATRIIATGFGFTRLAVPTGPGVRNQLNRRSEIIFE